MKNTIYSIVGGITGAIFGYLLIYIVSEFVYYFLSSAIVLLSFQSFFILIFFIVIITCTILGVIFARKYK